MKTGNFDWFLHAMLFYHTQHVIQKQKQTVQQIDVNDDGEGEEEEENNDEGRRWDVED